MLDSSKTVQRIAIIGGGWAGLSTAVHLVQMAEKKQRAIELHLFESAHELGGRAKRVRIEKNGQSLEIDNGQHIMLGAYHHTLALMETCGIHAETVFQRLPLQMVYPSLPASSTPSPTFAGMHFESLPTHGLTRLLPKLGLIKALLFAQGLGSAEKIALMRFSTSMNWMGWVLNEDLPVSDFLQRHQQPEKLCQLLWYPLCIAALNTPPERASAQVFLHILQKVLAASKADSDMLLPTVNLSALLPDACQSWLQQRKHKIHLGSTITALNIETTSSSPYKEKKFRLEIHQKHDTHDHSSTTEFDAVVCATPINVSQKLLRNIDASIRSPQNHETTSLAALFQEWAYEPITTCYLKYDTSLKLDRPFYALLEHPEQAHYGQFVFDRGQLCQDDLHQQGLLAVVISASTQALQHSQTHNHAALEKAIAMQLAHAFQGAPFAKLLSEPIWSQTITEKRATFACTPALARPAHSTPISGLYLAGDYTDLHPRFASNYPATLEAAVMSGNACAAHLCQDYWGN